MGLRSRFTSSKEWYDSVENGKDVPRKFLMVVGFEYPPVGSHMDTVIYQLYKLYCYYVIIRKEQDFRRLYENFDTKNTWNDRCLNEDVDSILSRRELFSLYINKLFPSLLFVVQSTLLLLILNIGDTRKITEKGRMRINGGLYRG